MPAGRSTYIPLPCFLLLAILAAPFVLLALLTAAAAQAGYEMPSNVHGDGILLVLLLFGSAGVSIVFVVFVLIATWPKAASNSRREERKHFLRTRKGALGLSAFLIAQLAILGLVLYAVSQL